MWDSRPRLSVERKLDWLFLHLQHDPGRLPKSHPFLSFAFPTTCPKII